MPAERLSEGVADRIGGIARKVKRRLRMGLRGCEVSIGVRRDLAEAFEAPAARIPIALRPFAVHDLPALFPLGDEEIGAREREDIAWRLAMVDRGALPSHCFVAVDERSGIPCHIQWLTESGYGDVVRRAGSLPTLGREEAMLENAYTPAAYRGLGIMSAVTAMLAERARDLGARYVVAFIDEANTPSLKGARRAGLQPYLVRTKRQYCFGLLRSLRFDPVAPGGHSGSPEMPEDASPREPSRPRAGTEAAAD